MDTDFCRDVACYVLSRNVVTTLAVDNVVPTLAVDNVVLTLAVDRVNINTPLSAPLYRGELSGASPVTTGLLRKLAMTKRDKPLRSLWLHFVHSVFK